MKISLLIITLLIFTNICFAQDFETAQQAYDSGNLTEAINIYEDLLKDEQNSPELYFNLGNALFREAHYSQAVLNYRRAWHLAPRDADIRANLQFAQESTGGILPNKSTFQKILEYMSKSEWLITAIICYWLAMSFLCLSIIKWPLRTICRRPAIAFFMILLLSIYAMYYWNSFKRHPEAVILSDQKALFAPLANSTAHISIPAGSIVQMMSKSGEWREIAISGKRGWIKANTCSIVLLSNEGM